MRLGRGGDQIDPAPKKAPLKKLTLIRVNPRPKRKILLFPEMRMMRKIFNWAAANFDFLINLIETYT